MDGFEQGGVWWWHDQSNLAAVQAGCGGRTVLIRSGERDATPPEMGAPELHTEIPSPLPQAGCIHDSWGTRGGEGAKTALKLGFLGTMNGSTAIGRILATELRRERGREESIMGS